MEVTIYIPEWLIPGQHFLAMWLTAGSILYLVLCLMIVRYRSVEKIALDVKDWPRRWEPVRLHCLWSVAAVAFFPISMVLIWFLWYSTPKRYWEIRRKYGEIRVNW